MKNFFHHLLIPRHTNNFRARVLHASILSVFAILFFGLSVSVQYLKTNHPQVLGISYSITTQDLLVETNKKRAENGLPPLALSESLVQAAQGKASHMMENHYWAHFAPDGTTPWKFIKDSGYEYTFAGENLAKGFTNSSDVVTAWMNSPSHKENLLSQKYNEIGFAILEGRLEDEDTVLVVQMFGSRVDAIEPQSVARIPPSEEQIQNPKSVLQETQEEMLIPKKVLTEQVIVRNPVIDSQSTTKNLGILLVIFLGAILIIDLLIVERKKIPRIAGHNMDHIILFLLFGLFILLESNASIL